MKEWTFVRVDMIKISDPIANPHSVTPQYLAFREEIAKQMPFLHFHQAVGVFDGERYFGNGRSWQDALHNLASAAGVFFSGPDPIDYFSDENFMKRIANDPEFKERLKKIKEEHGW